MGTITDGVYRGTVSITGIIGYNGAWDSSWGSAGNRSAYVGRNKYYTVIRFEIGTDYNSYTGSGWIAVAANLLSNISSQTNYNRTLSYGISKVAPTVNSSTIGLPSSFIGGERTGTWAVNNQSKESWFQVGDANSPISFSAGTYYLWIWSTNANEMGQFYTGSSYYRASAAMFAYTQCGAPTYFSVSSTSSTNIKYSENVTVEWSGATAGIGQSITGYKILYKYGSYPTLISFDGEINVSAAATSVTIPIPFKNSTSNRGKTAYFRIRTLSNNSSYHSNFKNCSNTVKCNSLPVINTLTSDKQIFSSTETIKPKITISASDIDGQGISYYYQKSDSSTKTKFTSEEILTLSAGTYYFYAYDGKEYSVSKSIKFTQNIKPIIENIEDNLITTSGYLTGGTIKVNVNKSNNGSCTCTLKSEEDNIKKYTGSLSGSTFIFTVNTSDFSETLNDIVINKVIIEYKDSYEEIALKELSVSDNSFISKKILGKNNINSLNLSIELNSDINDTSLNSTYFNKNFNCIINTDNTNTDFIQSKILNLYNTYDNKSYNFDFGTEINLDYSSSSYNGLEFTPKVTLKDLYGRVIVTTFSARITKLIPISFNSNEGIEVSPRDFKPLSEPPSGDVKITFAATHITFNGEAINDKNLDKILNFNLYFSNIGYSTSTNVSLNGSSNLEVTFNASEFNNIWNVLYDFQNRNGLKVTINPILKVVDKFGNISEGKSTKDFIIDYNEAPEFNNKTIDLYHKKVFYDTIEKVNSIFASISNIPDSTPKDSDYKINGGEILIIKHPLATDKNEANTLTYDILATFSKGDISLETSIINTNNYLELCRTFEDEDSNYMYWIFLVKKEIQLCSMKKIKVEVTDGSNKDDIPLDDFSSDKSNQSLNFFPIGPFNFKCTNCNFTNKDNKISINANFEVSNISGYSTYSIYSNLERPGEDNFGKSKLEIYYSKEVSTLDSDTNRIDEILLNSGAEGLSEISSFSNLDIFSLSSYDTIKEATNKGYFRFKLILNYGIDSDNKDVSKEVRSDIFFFENLEPTVSYRQNSVSINHKIKDEELKENATLYQNAFSVYSTLNNSKIYLVNNKDTSQKIIINLSDGSISGATISGGTW